MIPVTVYVIKSNSPWDYSNQFSIAAFAYTEELAKEYVEKRKREDRERNPSKGKVVLYREFEIEEVDSV